LEEKMGKNNFQWIIIFLLILVVILVVPRGLSYGYRGSMHSGYGMMGPGMMGYGMIGFGWLIPVIVLILVIATGVWLGNVFTGRKTHHQPHSDATCPKCSKPIEADWKTCPHCSESLSKKRK
jgi:uncharacterized membrane protein